MEIGLSLSLTSNKGVGAPAEPAVLLETGDDLLLESGEPLLLEA